MAIKLKNFLELYEPKAGNERKFVAKHVVKKTKDANKNDDKLFTGSNIKPINREKEHGYNPGNDEKVYEEAEHLEEMNVGDAKELATKSKNQGKPRKAAMYMKIAIALERGDRTTASGFINQLKSIDEASLSPDEMKKREDYVKGMKKNMKSFTSKYGKDAKSVMYGTATNMAKEDVDLDEDAVTDYYNKKRDMRDVEHKKQDPKTQSNHYAKNMVDTEKAAKKANERGIKKDARDFDWKVRNGVQRGKLPEETVVEGTVSPTAGTRKVASYGDDKHTAEVRYHPEYQEYQVHHYKGGKHQGEGPVSYHYGDKHDAHNTAKYSVGIKESRGHKIIATKLANMERMKNVEIPAAADRKKDKNNAKGAFKDMFGGDSKDLMSGLKIKEDLDGTLLGLYLDLDEENQQDLIEMIDMGNKEELIVFAATLKDNQ